jgi:hypothetical protein
MCRLSEGGTGAKAWSFGPLGPVFQLCSDTRCNNQNLKDNIFLLIYLIYVPIYLISEAFKKYRFHNLQAMCILA